ncbi:MAG: metallophosphoesterase [Thermodesulfobacteriota bacterium]
MKFLYASDLHGKISLYEGLFSLAISSSAEIIALGGDLLPSLPPTKRYEDMLPNQMAFISQFLRGFLKEIIERTRTKRIFLISGNWDLGYPYLFEESTEGIVDLNQKIDQISDGYELIGYPFVPPTPFRPKDYEKMDDPESAWPPQKNPSYIRTCEQTVQLTPIDPHLFLKKRETIREDLDRLPKPPQPNRAIYIMHSPPFGTRLDVIEGGKSAGSRSIRAFIQEHQPLLTLHGHIHESPDLSGSYFDRIGKTLSINPGQSIWKEKESSKLYAVTFEMENLEGTLKHTYYHLDSYHQIPNPK